MAFLTLQQAAKELGFKSIQSVRDHAAAGNLTIIYLPALPGRKRKHGPPRVDSEELKRFQRQCIADSTVDHVPAAKRSVPRVAPVDRPRLRYYR